MRNETTQPTKNKPGRRRIACIACSANKQKCDGALRHPCRRCELYNIRCEHLNGEVPKTAVRIDTTQQAAPVASTSGATAGSSAAGGSDDVAAAIREMTARLAAIEAGLEADRRAGSRPPTSLALPGSSNSAPVASTSASTSSSTLTGTATSAHPHTLEMPVESNPLQVLVSTMEAMNRDEQGPMSEGEDEDGAAGEREEKEEDYENLSYLEQLAWKARSEPRSARCDAFARGLATLEDVNAAFGFYTQRIQPWVPVVERRPALVVREKSPFFFHVILLVANYYNTSTAPRAREVYAGLNAVVHELLVQHILAPDPSLLTRDFVRALLLLLYYKPVQAVYAERGLTSSSRVVHASKVNALSSMMIHALIRQASSFIGINQAPLALKAYLDSPNPDDIPPAARERATSDFRTWCTIIAADAQGSLQSGRMSWTDPTAALGVARRFAALANDATDVRRAAVLELYSIVTVPRQAQSTTNPVRYRLEQLTNINKKLDEWREYWAPVLAEAQEKGDPLAYTVVQTISQFVILAVNGAVFSRWELEKKKELEEGKEGRPTLTSEDWRHLQRAADAAEAATFVVAVEAATGHPLRECRWPEPVNGQRGPLQLDARVTEDFKTALDTMTCIAFVYSLLFLVRMASAGLITCDLKTRQADYEAGCDLSTPQALTTGQKLPRLLEVGSQFLTSISPNPDHPARRHALLVEMILRVGLGATSPAAHASSPAGSKGDKRSPPSVPDAVPPPQARPVNSLVPGQPLPAIPNLNPVPVPTHLQQQQPLLPQQPQAVAPRPPVSSFDSWLWDTSTPTAASFSGPLRMHDGSFVMPDLSGGGGGGGGGGSASPAVDQAQLAARPASSGSNAPQSMSSADRTAALAMVAGAGRRGGAAEAMASLLNEVNPFLDDSFANAYSQPSLGGLGSHAFNDDFGLGGASVGGLDAMSGFDWAMAAPGAGMPFGGGAMDGTGAWPYGSGSS
ncbi:hypothetical protein JCM10213_003195 [Rhodosporidiobolus nylandii]